MSQPVESPHMLFPFERFRFTIKVTSLMVLPPYKGAVFRGAFGNAFRRIVCAVPKADCTTCMLRLKCLYVSIFEPPPPANYPDAAKFSTAPAPYVLNPPLTEPAGISPRRPAGFRNGPHRPGNRSPALLHLHLHRTRDHGPGEQNEASTISSKVDLLREKKYAGYTTATRKCLHLTRRPSEWNLTPKTAGQRPSPCTFSPRCA